jgi:hypothetical protein
LSTGTLSRDLDDLQAGLEEILSCYESEQFPEVVVVDTAWTRVKRAFGDLQADLEALPSERGAVQGRIDTCLRLYAVASGLLVRRREEMVVAQASCVNARQTLRRNRSQEASGSSCDLSA